MPTSADYLPRKAATLVSEALSDTRIVIINGARQAGKSTLARTVSQSLPHVLSRSLDRPAQRNAAISFGGGLGCLPISALWTTSP